MKIKSSFLCLLTAAIWGFAFVAQRVGLEKATPLLYLGTRTAIGALFLVILIIFTRKRAKAKGTVVSNENQSKLTLLVGGVLCGITLFLASYLQQLGLIRTSVGKTGFITAFYIILVPIFGIFLKKKTGVLVWISVVIALAALYLLCIKEGFSINLGDLFVFLCAIFYAAQILVIDHFSPKTDSLFLSLIQFITVSVLSFVLMPFFETPNVGGLFQAWIPLLYSGILATGLAFTLQIIAQKDMNPTAASLLLSMESVFAVLGGWWILGQKLSTRETWGCILMFIAVILAQLPQPKKRR